MAEIRKPSIAVAGATGLLGVHIMRAILSPDIRSHFSLITVLSQQPSFSTETPEWEASGVVLVTYDQRALSASLSGIDILINAIGSHGHELKEKLLHALAGTDVKMYFPSEFGVDHTAHEFSQAEWDYKKRQHAIAKRILHKDVKVCRIYCGLFLEQSFGPWYGFDTKHGKYENVGKVGGRTSYTSLGDVGRSVARLAILAMEQVPEELRLAGDTKSMIEVRDIMSHAGAGHIEITEIPADYFKMQAIGGKGKDPSKFIRLLMAEGKIDHTDNAMGNSNQLVNPNESRWKWKTVADIAAEFEGRPWKDFMWPPT